MRELLLERPKDGRSRLIEVEVSILFSTIISGL